MKSQTEKFSLMLSVSKLTRGLQTQFSSFKSTKNDNNKGKLEEYMNKDIMRAYLVCNPVSENHVWTNLPIILKAWLYCAK